MATSRRAPSRRHTARRAGTVLLACLVLAGCGGGEDDGVAGGADTAGAGTTPSSGAPPENPSFRATGGGPGMVAAQDAAEVKQAMRIIRLCRPGGRAEPALRDAVTTIVVVYEESGPEAHYESNDTLEPMNMRDVALQARAALQRCGAGDEVRRLDAVLAGSPD